METVNRNQVKMAYARTKKRAVKALYDNMVALEQGLIAKAELDKAIAKLECEDCGCEVKTGETVCYSCESKRKAEGARKRLRNYWEVLCKELNGFEKRYELVENERGYARIIIKEKDGREICKIEREAVYSSGYVSSSSSYALRIATSHSEIKANKLKKDFGAKGLAEALNKRCSELIEKIMEARKEAAKEAKETDKVEKLIKKGFGDIKLEREYVAGSAHRRGYFTDAKVFKYEGVELKTWDGKVYNVKKVNGRFDVKAAKKAIKFLKSQEAAMAAFVEENGIV